MDLTTVFHFATEFAYLLIIFGLCLLFAIFVGRQAIINIICGAYVTALLFAHFTIFQTLVNDLEKPLVIAGAKIALFVVLTLIISKLFKKLMPREYAENKFEGFGKKLLLAVAATILITAISLTLLPMTDFITPNTFILSTFANSELFFWWLLAPLVMLFIAG